MIFEFLYHSVMAPDASPTCVADIVRVARAFNRDNAITGLLIFDGERFCQLLEGDREAVTALVGRIEKDPRHQRFVTLYQGSRTGERRFPQWSMAYALDTQGGLGTLLEQRDGIDVPTLLERALTLFDLDAPITVR